MTRAASHLGPCGPWMAALCLALLAACATTPISPPPSPGDDPTSTTEPQPHGERPAVDPARLDFCEGLFKTLNELQATEVTPELRDAAEAQARTEAEGCREVFLAAADSPGSMAVAHAFADMMLLRAYDLRMERRQDTQRTEEVCPDSDDALARMRAMHEAATRALTELELNGAEKGVLGQVQASMVQRIDALEPFLLRGCRDGAFDPRRLISVADLSVRPTMSWEACFEIVIAFSAFDVEAAERAEIIRLIGLLEDAAPPCRRAFAPDPAPTNLATLKGHAFAALLDGAPLLVKTSVAFADQRVPEACQAIGDFLRLNETRVAMLTALVRAVDTDAETRTQAARELEAESRTRTELSETYRVMCAL